MKMERDLSRWAGMEPEAVADGSRAQIIWALRDAKKDIAALANHLADQDQFAEGDSRLPTLISAPAPLGSEGRENRATPIKALSDAAKSAGLVLCSGEPVGYQNIKTGVHATVSFYEDLIPASKERWMPLFAKEGG